MNKTLNRCTGFYYVWIILIISLGYGGEVTRISTTTYFKTAPLITSDSYFDGFGKVIQSHIRLNNKQNHCIVSAAYYDYLQRDSIIIKPFVYEFLDVVKYLPMWKFIKPGDPQDPIEKNPNLVDMANSEYPLANGYAFLENKYFINDYYSSYLNEKGIISEPYSLGASGNHVKIWRFGIKDYTTYVSSFDEVWLDWRTTLGYFPDPSPINYLLSVTRDANGNFVQEKRDRNGNIVAIKNQTITHYEYDLNNNLIKTTAPSLADAPGEDHISTTEYSTSGQVISEKIPDREDVTEYRYDRGGRLRFVKNANHKFKDSQELNSSFINYTVHNYDALSRNIQISEYRGTHSFDDPDGVIPNDPEHLGAKIIHIYDTLTADQLTQLGISVAPDILDAILGSLTNLKGNLVLSVAFSRRGSKIYKVIDFFSYDQENRLAIKYKIIPNLPIQKVTMAYDLQGNVLTESYYNGFDTDWKFVHDKVFEYDVNRRLQQVKMNNKVLVKYEYDDLGKLAKKTFHNEAGTELENLTYDYTLNDWTQKIQTGVDPTLFKQQLAYGEENLGEGFHPSYPLQFNGNISKILYKGKTSQSSFEYKLSYKYSALNQLINVSQGIADDDNEPFDESFIYDELGRFKKKKEGTNVLDNYKYTPNTNQLAYLDGHPTKGQTSGRDNYLYDPNGNMVCDRSKNMIIEYDWRDLPVTFKFYTGIPINNAASEPFAWEDFHELAASTQFNLINEVRMVYDASGSRVLKATYTPKQ